MMAKLTDILKSALEQKKDSGKSSKGKKSAGENTKVGKSQTTNSKVTSRGAARGS
jgi:hypothetical protein